MFYQKAIRSILCLVAIFSLLVIPHSPLLAISPQAPADAVITNCANDTQVRTAVAAVAAGQSSTITFSCGTATIAISGYMTVAGNVTIDGESKITLDGGGANAFFQVFASGNLNLRNLTLRKGKFNSVHPLEIFGSARLNNVRMEENQADTQGGAIVNYGNLQVSASTFLSNTVSGVLNTTGKGGAIANLSGSLNISATTFQHNQALNGGALFIAASTQATVTRSSFISNTAGYGGAIENNGEVQIDFSTFRQNRATTGDGGALWVLDGDGDITYSTFSDNSAATTGGAISCYANTLSVIHSTLNGNQASGNGGAIYSTCNLNVSNDTFSANRAPGKGGGGIYQAGTSVSASVAASTFANNSAAFGAGVYNDGAGSSTLNLQYTLLANNTTGNCDGVITSSGYNLSSDTNCGALTQTGDKQGIALALGALADNGGPTFTHLPLTGNPAINAIPTPCSFSVDQREVSRPQGDKCDIGAVEIVAAKGVYLPLIIR